MAADYIARSIAYEVSGQVDTLNNKFDVLMDFLSKENPTYYAALKRRMDEIDGIATDEFDDEEFDEVDPDDFDDDEFEERDFDDWDRERWDRDDDYEG